MLAVHQCLLVLLLLSGGENSEARKHRKWSTRENEADHDCATGCVCHTKQAFCDHVGFRILLRDFPKNVETIHFRDNYARKIKYIHLAELYQLKHLIMKGNRVSYIEPRAFSDLGNMVSLSLTENNLRYLSPDTFRFQRRLQVLSMRKNDLRSIEKLFWPLESLRLLNLADNRIKSLSEVTLKRNKQLRILDLHANRIKSIHKRAFKNLRFLTFLVLRDNPLKVIQLTFHPNSNIELLDFTNCRLSEVVKGLPFSVNDLRLPENNIHTIHEKDFKTIRKVRVMVLNNNNLENIHPNAFDKLWQLYALYIGSNRLKTLPSNLPKGIGQVYANYNNITHIRADDIAYRPNLQTLLLKHNLITHIDPKSFRGLYRLSNLDMRENAIRMLKPMVFRDAIQLQKLDLSANPLRELEHNCFKGLSNLHILQMSSVDSDSHIEPSVFKDTKKLMYLDLSNSSKLAKFIANSPHTLDYIQSVQDLNLMENQLSTLPAGFPKHFPHLKMIKLAGNPWHCDQTLLWLRDWLHNRTLEFFAPLKMTCETPAQLKGKLIRDLTLSDIHRSSYTQPIINLLNVSKYASNRYHKAFLGKDGKWYLFNTALSGKRDFEAFSPKRLGKLLSQSNSTLTRKPRPPGAFVLVKETLKGQASKKHKFRQGKGRGRGRGREVAALNALIPEHVTAMAVPGTLDPLGRVVNPSWGPALQQSSTPTGTSKHPGKSDPSQQHADNDVEVRNMQRGHQPMTEVHTNNNVSPQASKIPTNQQVNPQESILPRDRSVTRQGTQHVQEKVQGQGGHVEVSAKGPDTLSEEREAPEGEADIEESEESTSGSPIDDDTSGFVSGDDFLIV